MPRSSAFELAGRRRALCCSITAAFPGKLVDLPTPIVPKPAGKHQGLGRAHDASRSRFCAAYRRTCKSNRAALTPPPSCRKKKSGIRRPAGSAITAAFDNGRLLIDRVVVERKLILESFDLRGVSFSPGIPDLPLIRKSKRSQSAKKDGHGPQFARGRTIHRWPSGN